MTYVLDDEIRGGLRRLSWGLQLRIVLVAVGIPLWVWTVQARHPAQAWIEGAFWLISPLTDLLMAWGAHRMGARAGAAALLMAAVADLYAGLVGFSGSVLGRGQIPFAMSFAELLGLLGLFSTLAFLRGPVEDAGENALASRIYRAMAQVIICLACSLVVRVVMWQGYFAGLAATIIASAVVVLVIVALLEVLAVLRMCGELTGSHAPLDADGDPATPLPQAPRAVPGYHRWGFRGRPRGRKGRDQ